MAAIITRKAASMAVIFVTLLFAISLSATAVSAQSPAPAPAPLLEATSDGTSIDQGIAYVLMLLALVVTYIIH